VSITFLLKKCIHIVSVDIKYILGGDILNIGENIKKYRKASRLTQKELAEKIGVSTITIQNYENSRREPSIEKLNKIAKELGINASSLLSDNFSSKINEFDETIKEIIICHVQKYNDTHDDKVIENLINELISAYRTKEEYILKRCEDNMHIANKALKEKDETIKMMMEKMKIFKSLLDELETQSNK